jgi:hypothetical protein
MPKVNINIEPIKKNGVAIACGVVAVAAVVLAFYPLGSKRQDLQTELQGSAGMMGQIDSLLHKQRTLPAIDGGDPKPIEKFPNETIIKDGNNLVAAVTKQSGDMLNAAVRLNQHNILVFGSLPSPSSALKIRFRDDYLTRIQTEVPRIVSGASPPSQADVDRAIKDETARISDPANGIAIVVNGAVVNPQDVQNKIAERTLAIPREMRDAIAEQHKMYLGLAVGSGAQNSLGLNPMVDALTLKQEITPAAIPPDDITIWLAQLQLWIQEDVAQGLAEVNQSAKNVTDAPVKHLIKINLPPQNPYVIAPGSANSVDPAAQIPLMKQYSPTGRVCCPLYDVVHFTVTLRVRTSDLPNVIETLERNRLITVWQCNVNTFDAAAAAAAGFSYGTDPVVEVQLNCEELFLRKWTQPLMPPAVRKYLNIPDPVAPAAPTPAA